MKKIYVFRCGYIKVFTCIAVYQHVMSNCSIHDSLRTLFTVYTVALAPQSNCSFFSFGQKSRSAPQWRMKFK